MKYVKCVNAEGCPQIGEDNVYRALNEGKNGYLIDKGAGFCESFDKSRFIDVEVIEKGNEPKPFKRKTSDTIYTPAHYKKGIETWDYTDSWGMDFLEGNIIKYVTRWKDKNGVDDLRKALMYLQRLLEREENKNEN